MRFLRCVKFAALGLILCNPMLASASEPVGEAVLIKTEVTGAGGPLAVDDQVHRDERIKTSSEGLGQFVFRDGTKLAVGLGSSVVIDKFVFDDSDTVKKLTIKAAKGSFRWISGNSESSAYKILTPAGTIGVRGTAFDFYVDRNGTTAVVLLGGAVQFCGPGGCRQLTQRCDCMIAKTNGEVSQVSRVNQNTLKTLRNDRAMPFLTGMQQLYGRMAAVGGGNCGLGRAKDSQAPSSSPRTRDTQSPAPASPQSPAAPQAPTTQAQASPRTEVASAAPSAPASPSAPSTPSTPGTPNTPSDPGTPSAPSDPDPPDRHHGRHHHDRHGGWHDHRDNDRDHRGWGRHGRGHGDWGRDGYRGGFRDGDGSDDGDGQDAGGNDGTDSGRGGFGGRGYGRHNR